MLNTDSADPDLWYNEHILSRQYESFAIVGIDEAGRGSLAGPVTASAVCFYQCKKKPFVMDSKKLSPKKREIAYGEIQESGAYISTSFVSARMIDKMNILNATKWAMKKCIDQILFNPTLQHCPLLFLIDGNQPIVEETRGIQKTCIKGDSLYSSIASASIIAKVERDQYMVKMDRIFPLYGFSVHKGYGTKRHFQALHENGMSSFHRRTFLKGIQ
ncbi:MAG: ribonuclease HII [Caldisericia bacterium]|nr:ribonuclease HII [Caldisericia bacterium]MDD4613913.1 ribonuclease HII [Caldisericia bacterium]